MKNGVRWATAALVLFNVAFFGVYLFRNPGRRGSGSGSGSGSAMTTATAGAVGAAGQAGVYAVTGVVKEVRQGGSNVMIRHEAIPGYMVAMTMPFHVRDPREVADVKEGERVTFRLLVTDEESWIDTVRRADGVEPAPAFAYEQSRVVRDVEPLEIGQTVPDYPFTNELGGSVKLGDYRGKAVALTFFFTRCPLPEFCPKMMKNFSEVAEALRARQAVSTNWHLLAVTIDPYFDTPTVMRGYGERYQYDPVRWSFLTGALIEIDALAEQVGLMYRRQAPTSIPDHNLRTLIIDPAGRLKKVIVGNSWKPAEVVDDLIALTGAGGGGEGGR